MKAIKVKIYPKKDQIELIEKHFGCNRFVYNWALNQKIEFYKQKEKSLSEAKLMGMLTKVKHEDNKEWLKEVHSQTLQQSIKDLESAFSHFFRKNNSFPKFKSRKNPKQSFRFPQGFKIDYDKHYVKLPKIGWVRFKDKFNVPINAEFRNITISRKNNKYYASMIYDSHQTVPKKKKPTKNKTLGIDLGTTHLAIYSDGTKTNNPRHLKKYEKQLKETQQKLSNQEKGSKSYEKTKLKVAKIHEKVSNTRKDFLHKLTTSLVENQDYTSISIEDLAVKDMLQSKENNKHMDRAIGDASWRMLRTMLEYKCKEKGKNLLAIGRWDASSKTCSNCGNVYHELKREEREWTCSKCSSHHDRDVNAAINIRDFGIERFKRSGSPLAER